MTIVATRRGGGFGEGRWLEQEKLSEMSVCKCKRECVRSSRMCSGSRRSFGRAGAGAGTAAARVASRVAAVRRGRSRGGSAQDREGGGEAGEDAWKGSEPHGGGGSTAHGQQSGSGSRAQREQRRPGLEEENED
jgi:hypothetical protein